MRIFSVILNVLITKVCHYIKFGVILNVSCINIDSEQYNVDLRDIQNIYLIVVYICLIYTVIHWNISCNIYYYMYAYMKECLLYIYYFILWSGVDQYLACLYFLTSCFQRNSAGSNYFDI